MTKRPLDDDDSAYPPDPSSTGLLPINDLLSPNDDLPAGAIKRPRNFIASVVRSPRSLRRLKKGRKELIHALGL